ncbi:MAG: MFS transporter [Anaerolineae bacterium]|jgi:DHA3 family macrolide efflux protein-like MFS transporter|nr:MFS transporter [Anaerolineae bacterium]
MSTSDTSKSPVNGIPQQPGTKPWAAQFFTIWVGQGLSLVGSQMGGFALVWWLTQASGGSATILATSSLVATLPLILLGPFAGALVDRWSRRRVMIVADSLVAAFSALLAVLAWNNALQIWHIYGIVFVRALGGTFHFAAMQAATSLMVPSDQLARVSGMNQVLRGALGIITPPLGALAMSVMPLYAIMGIDVATAAFAIAPLFFVPIPDPARGPRAAEGSPGLVRGLLVDVREGFAYIWRWTGLFIVLVVAALLNGVINPAFALMPILVKEHFGGDVLQLGWAESAWGIGLIVGGLLLSVWGGFKRRVYTSLLGLAVAGLSFATVGIAPAGLFKLALAGLFVAGLSNPIINGPFLAILQSVVAPDVQGRVFTAVESLAGIAAPVGMLIAGPVADALGVQVWFLIGGIISAAMGIGLRAIPAVMHLEDYRRESTADAGQFGTLSQASE